MMNSNSNKTQCSFCQVKLAWWSASSCAYCGHAICKHHAHLVKRAHSNVLASVCGKCAEHAGLRSDVMLLSQANEHLLSSHQHVAAR